MEKHKVVIVGGGPAGLACATRLQARGIIDVVVLEREQEAGGVPRHCGHWGFGWESHRWIMSGPAYAAKLRHEAKAIDVRTGTTVLNFTSPHVMRLQNADGISEMQADHVILATGARESTRASRFIGGARVPQVINTGTLQQLVYLKHMKPFARPVIIGGEWVSFSALMTCNHAGIQPVAMLVEDVKIDAPWFFPLGTKLRYGVSVHTSTRVIAVHGTQHVEAVEVEHHGKRRTIPCDGVIVSGRFVPEDTLFADMQLHSHVHLAGNATGDLKTAGRCVVEARGIANAMGVSTR